MSAIPASTVTTKPSGTFKQEAASTGVPHNLQAPRRLQAVAGTDARCFQCRPAHGGGGRNSGACAGRSAPPFPVTQKGGDCRVCTGLWWQAPPRFWLVSLKFMLADPAASHERRSERAGMHGSLSSASEIPAESSVTCAARPGAAGGARPVLQPQQRSADAARGHRAGALCAGRQVRRRGYQRSRRGTAQRWGRRAG